MKREAPTRQQQTQAPQERPQNPQPSFEPEQAEIPHDDIAQRAYAIYLERGGFPGAELDDWLQAEQELRNRNEAAA